MQEPLFYEESERKKKAKRAKAAASHAAQQSRLKEKKRLEQEKKEARDAAARQREIEKAAKAAEQEVRCSIRPEEFIICKDGTDGIHGTVQECTYLGLNTHYTIDTDQGDSVEIVEESWVRSQSWVVSLELVDLMDSQC